MSAAHKPAPAEATKDPRVPATIRNHPGVQFAVLGEEQGSDYRYFVGLRDGWIFTAGAKAACTGGGFNSVQDFRYANAKITERKS